MNIKNCITCGKIYNYDGFTICPTCRKANEGDFQKLKDYLYKNPGADISEVHEETGVDTKKIIDFLKEGRLEIKGGGNLILECEGCGVSITTGRFCNKCTSDLQRELGQAAGSPKVEKSKTGEKEKSKFRVIDRYNNKK